MFFSFTAGNLKHSDLVSVEEGNFLRFCDYLFFTASPRLLERVVSPGKKSAILQHSHRISHTHVYLAHRFWDFTHFCDDRYIVSLQIQSTGAEGVKIATLVCDKADTEARTYRLKCQICWIFDRQKRVGLPLPTEFALLIVSCRKDLT